MEKKADIKRQLKQILHDVRLKCKEDCSAGDRKSWLDCNITDCALYNHRLGNVREKNTNFTKEKQPFLSKNAIVEDNTKIEKGVKDETKINE